MVNVLLVDDEQIERDGLQLILERHFNNLVVHQARNGGMAIELAEQFRPDLVFMDIQMPGISGLEAIERLRAAHPSAKFILVTAFASFEYAQQAVKLGVNDYIVKPSKIAEIVKTVQGVLDQINQEQRSSEEIRQNQDTIKKAMAIFETDVVTQLLFDHVHEIHLHQLVELLGIPITEDKFVMSLLLPKDAAKSYSAVKEIVRKTGSGWTGALNGRQIPIIVFREAGRSFRQQAISLANKILSLREHTQAEWFIGIGSVYKPIEKIKQSYQESILATRNDQQPVKYQFYSDLPSLTLDLFAHSYKAYEQTFYSYLHHQHWDQLIKEVDTIIEKLERENQTVIQAQKQLAEILWLLSSILADMGIAVELSVYSSQVTDYKQLRAETAYMLQRMKDTQEEYNLQTDGDIIEQIKQYIIEHAHEDLSLELISREAGLSPIYMSKLFKEKLGINYISFLTECRLEKAKKLMRDSEKSMKEISIDIGYHDPNYFSKVFKKAFHMSPTDYRKQRLS
ncbi:response regulator [Jeotgalibacillus proteolyticus]|uniref:DNA-binding response regulator n=1 Tax=Jeotgalibacillus proteolyticus TaxID=2082395 RepID=A0A2S5G8P9_9BACL|nr:response regulator [Jeotgalibacillus proteolyticus]PPA69359.1 DNA-binding response regulator [Jeotgalibacillus proteolyticus]